MAMLRDVPFAAAGLNSAGSDIAEKHRLYRAAFAADQKRSFAIHLCCLIYDSQAAKHSARRHDDKALAIADNTGA